MIRGLATVASTVAMLCLAGMMLLTVADVTLRAIDPAWRIFGMLDYVEFSLSWMIFLSIAVTMLVRDWVVVDLVDRALPAVLRIALRTAGVAAAVVAIALMVAQTVTPAFDALDWGDKTLDLGLPKFWYWVSIWVGLGLAAIGAVLSLPDEIRDARGDGPAPGGSEPPR
ncbi:MAG: TRAP transporter small permease [Gemmobacter sp.]